MRFLIPAVLFAVVPMGVMAQGNKSGLHEENFDKSVRPADDFYQFATGGWQKNNPLPAAYSRFGSFDLLQENVNKQVNEILTDLRKKTYKTGTIEQKLSDFYKLALDVDRRNQEGIAPVKALLDEMEAAKTKEDLQALQLKYAEQGYGVSFVCGFGADEKNSTMNIFNVYQSGLTLGQKDYYVNNDSATVAIRKAYREFIADMFQLYGFSEEAAKQKEQAVFQHETTLALISKSATELRDPQANYNKMTLMEFNANYPNLRLEVMSNAEGIKSEWIQEMVVGQPEFLAGLDKIVVAESAETLRALMEWDVIMQVESQMGEALGNIYVKRYFPASSKKMMEELVHNLQISLGQRIDAQTWMSDSTKAAAHKKLDRFYVKIGYPNKWHDYSTLIIDPAKSYYENVMACRKFAHDKHIEGWLAANSLTTST